MSDYEDYTEEYDYGDYAEEDYGGEYNSDVPDSEHDSCGSLTETEAETLPPAEIIPRCIALLHDDRLAAALRLKSAVAFRIDNVKGKHKKAPLLSIKASLLHLINHYSAWDEVVQGPWTAAAATAPLERSSNSEGIPSTSGSVFSPSEKVAPELGLGTGHEVLFHSHPSAAGTLTAVSPVDTKVSFGMTTNVGSDRAPVVVAAPSAKLSKNARKRLARAGQYRVCIDVEFWCCFFFSFVYNTGTTPTPSGGRHETGSSPQAPLPTDFPPPTSPLSSYYSPHLEKNQNPY